MKKTFLILSILAFVFTSFAASIHSDYIISYDGVVSSCPTNEEETLVGPRIALLATANSGSKEFPTNATLKIIAFLFNDTVTRDDVECWKLQIVYWFNFDATGWHPFVQYTTNYYSWSKWEDQEDAVNVGYLYYNGTVYSNAWYSTYYVDKKLNTGYFRIQCNESPYDETDPDPEPKPLPDSYTENGVTYQRKGILNRNNQVVTAIDVDALKLHAKNDLGYVYTQPVRGTNGISVITKSGYVPYRIFDYDYTVGASLCYTNDVFFNSVKRMKLSSWDSILCGEEFFPDYLARIIPVVGGSSKLDEGRVGEIATNVVRETTETLSNKVESVSADVSSALLYSSGIYQYMIGNTNAWFEGTNYNTNAETAKNKVHYSHEDWEDVQYTPSSLQLYEIRDGVKNVVWDQRDWTVYYWNFKSAQLSNNLARATSALADHVKTNSMSRGWSKYTAVNGIDNPDPNTLWVDTENVSLMAGKNWEKLVTVGGAGYYTLTGNGVDISPESATNTFLTIKDFEGNAVLTFRKTSSYLVYCECGTDITENYRDSDGRVVFKLTTDVCPTAEFSTVLDSSSFVEQGDDGCPANYEWTGSANNWECHFLLKDGIESSACFARFKVQREGENVIEYSQPIRINGGISFEQDGKTYKIKPSVSGTTVTWSIVQ